MFLTRTPSPTSRNLDPFAVFDEIFSPSRLRGVSSVLPLDLWEEDDAIHAEIELPGVREEDVDLSVFEKQLHIRVRHEEMRPAGETREENQPGRRYIARERTVGQLERVVPLPYDVDADKVEAEMEGGVLNVRMPKADGWKPRRIEVKRSKAKN